MTRARQPPERGVTAVRLGHGANCSSIGSVIDTLFASAAVGTAIFAAVAAALAREEVTEVKASAGAGTGTGTSTGGGTGTGSKPEGDER